jgi:arginase family enzyme
MPAQDRFGVRDLGAPWYAGNPSFMRAPWVEPSEVPEGHIAVAGMPVDAWVAARTGARWGPRAIRQSSLVLAGYWGLQPDIGFLSSRTGDVVKWPAELHVVDTGDVPIHPTDVSTQMELAIEHIAAASLTSQITVILGGDHVVCYPGCEGVLRAWRQRKSGLKAGYLHIDSHADFFDEITFLGRYNHGTSARRVSEIGEVSRMAWFGINGETSLEPNQFQVMYERGFRVCTSYYSQRVGAASSMEAVLDYVTEGVDILYVSIDIDVVSAAHAPATHTPTFEALTAQEFIEALRVLAEVDNLVGIDMCEVAPTIDTSQRTERLAALGLMTVIGPRVFDTEPGRSKNELEKVFWT